MYDLYDYSGMKSVIININKVYHLKIFLYYYFYFLLLGLYVVSITLLFTFDN